MCLIDDCEASDFLYQEKRKARKKHTCSECRRAIAIGEEYIHSSFKSDGKIYTNKSCEHCEIAASWLNKHCGGAVFFGVKEDLEEHYSSGYREDGLQRILIGIRRGWKAFYGDGLLPKNEILMECKNA
ncbi:MAG: hypothetical protein ACRC62_05380 [Microcoleus sp.]